jgi:hypothetical protein
MRIPMLPGGGKATCEEVSMADRRTARITALVTLVSAALLVLALAPAGAQAAWTSAEARIIDPLGTGVIPLLNVSVANHAVNDASPVTTVQFSDDWQDWYVLPYTGEPCDWVLAGMAGQKTLAVRFGAADGSVSDVVEASIRVDTAGPVTLARSAMPAGAGRTLLRFVIRDPGSARVTAGVVVRGEGVVKRFSLGSVRTGARTALVKLRLAAGTYRWHVTATDLAGWTQERQTAGRLVVR